MKRFVYFPDPDDSDRLVYMNLFELNYSTKSLDFPDGYVLVDTTKSNTTQQAPFDNNGSVIFFAFTTPEFDALDESDELTYWNGLWRDAIERPYTDVVIPLFPGVNPEDIQVDTFTTTVPTQAPLTR